MYVNPVERRQLAITRERTGSSQADSSSFGDTFESLLIADAVEVTVFDPEKEGRGNPQRKRKPEEPEAELSGPQQPSSVLPLKSKLDVLA